VSLSILSKAGSFQRAPGSVQRAPIAADALVFETDFHFYDMGGHRIARCARTGMVTDFTATTAGIFIPEDGEWTTIDGKRWKWEPGE
jgi:hypothetical protein